MQIQPILTMRTAEIPQFLASDYLQRLMAGCPVKEPDPIDYPKTGDALAALYETYQQSGLQAVKRSWDALCHADPAMADLLPPEGSLYNTSADLTPELLADLDRYPYDDLGQALALVHLFHARLRFLPGAGWYVWTGGPDSKSGGRWQLDRQEATLHYMAVVARARQQAASSRKVADQDDQDKQKHLQAKKARDVSWANNGANAHRLASCERVGRTMPTLIASHTLFDRDTHLLGVKNGVVDLRTGHLRPARPEQYITYSTNVSYFPDAQAPRWEQFISEIFGGKADLVGYIQRAIGYSLTGDISEQCLFMCYGSGANGKSVLLNMIKALGGEYTANAPFSTFEHGQQSGVGQDIVQLRGRRMVSSSETDDGSRLNEARIKAITGGDEVTGRYLFSRHELTFVPTFKIWFATNYKPTIRGNDEGIWRRIRLIPFLENFSQDKRDPHLESKLRAELPGILAWAVRGAMAWHTQGLGEPVDVVEATSEYREESDIMGLFLSESTVRHEAASVQSGALYKSYQAWTEANGLGTLSNVKFSRAMEARGFEKRKTSAHNQWIGIGLRENG